MPRATTCLLNTKEIGVDQALRLRDQAKQAHQPKLDFRCSDCGNEVNPFKDSSHGAAHFEHLRRNAACPLSDPERK